MASRPDLGSSFRRMLAASTATNLADGVVLATVPLLARQLTADPLVISSVTVATTLPWLLFALPAGVLVDRSDHVRVMRLGNGARAVILTLLSAAVVSGRAGIPLVLAVVFVAGVCETVVDTAAQAWLPGAVHHDLLETANGRLFGAQIAANTLAGPALGAGLFSAAMSAPFVAVAGLFGVSVVALPRAGARQPRAPRAPIRPWHDVAAGLRWVIADPGVRAFAIGAATINLAYTAAMAVAVLLLRDELGMPAWGYGLTLSAAAVGGIAGARAAAVVVRRLGRRGAALVSAGGFAIALAGAGLGPHGLAVAAALGLSGAAGEIWNVVAVSYRQARVPTELLGRVMATYRFVAYGAMPAGAALGGIATRSLGVRGTYIAAAAVVGALLPYLAAALPSSTVRS